MTQATAPKVAIVYYSSTGNVHQLAESVAEGARNAGAEVRVVKARELAPPEAVRSNAAWQANADATQDVPEARPEDTLWADAIIFGTPTRYGNVSAQLKQFIDTLGPLWAEGKLADKVYSGFTSTATAHGGQESTLLALYNTVHHFGGITVTPGYTDPVQYLTGNPYGVSHVDAQGEIPISDDTLQAARYQGKRVATVATALKASDALQSEDAAYAS